MHGHACAHTWTEHACTNTHKKREGTTEKRLQAVIIPRYIAAGFT